MSVFQCTIRSVKWELGGVDRVPGIQDSIVANVVLWYTERITTSSKDA